MLDETKLLYLDFAATKNFRFFTCRQWTPYLDTIKENNIDKEPKSRGFLQGVSYYLKKNNLIALIRAVEQTVE